MLTVRDAQARGHANHGWLDTYHTFSFGDYHAREHMGYRSLRVINEDRVDPGRGFGMHPHRDMEIVTYVLSGALEHRDSMGSGSVLRAGGFQRMTAGTGISHSESNPSQTEPVHLYQIWIQPERAGLEPSYEERSVDGQPRGHGLHLMASPDGRDGSMTIHQDAVLYVARLDPGGQLEHTLGKDRHAWVQVSQGSLTLNGRHVVAGDGVAIDGEPGVRLEAAEGAEDTEGAEAILFDLA